MKRLIILFFLFILFNSISANENENKTINNSISFKLNNVNKSGIVLLSTGLTATGTGIALFIVDSVINVKIILKDTHYGNEYTTERIQNTNYALFASSLALMLTGGILITISIPLMLYQKKKVSLNINSGNKLSIALSYKF